MNVSEQGVLAIFKIGRKLKLAGPHFLELILELLHLILRFFELLLDL